MEKEELFKDYDKNLLVGEYSFSLEICIPEKKYSAKVSPQKEGVTDIAVCPKDISKDTLKKSFMLLCREKIHNEISYWNSLAQKMIEDKITDEDVSINIDELSQFLIKKDTGKVI